MKRAHLLAVVATLTLAACTDRPTELKAPEPSPEFNLVQIPGCNTARIAQLVVWLVPSLADRIAIGSSINGGLVAVQSGQLLLARKVVFGVIALLKQQAVQDRLATPPSSSSLTKEQAIAELSNLLLACVGLSGEIPPGAFGAGGAVKVIPPTGAKVITTDGQLGMSFPDASTSTPPRPTFLIAIAQVHLDAELQPRCFVGSLYHEYGNCYNVQGFPDPGALSPHAAGEMCSFAENGLPGSTPTATVHARLQVATQKTPTSDVEILDRIRENLPFGISTTTCTAATLANAGRRRGALYRTGAAAGALFARLTRPFLPTMLFAADGIGFDIPHISRFRGVDPVISR
jgi:hypothetical protein